MVLSAKGRASAKKHKARQKARQLAKDKARGKVKTKDYSGKKPKRSFIGTPIGELKVDPGVPTSPERAKEMAEREKISVRRQLSRAKTTGAVREVDGRLVPTSKSGASVLSRVASVEGRVAPEPTGPVERVDLLLPLEDFKAGEGRVFARGRDKTIAETDMEVKFSRIKPAILKEAVKDFMANERAKAVTIKGQRVTREDVADLLAFEKKVQKEKEAFKGELRAFDKVSFKDKLKARSQRFKEDLLLKTQGMSFSETERVVARALGLSKVERELLIASGKYKPKTKLGVSAKDLTQALISEVFAKPLENTALLLSGAVIGKTVRAGSKIIKVVSRSSPRLAGVLRAGGNAGGVALLTAYASGIVKQAQEERLRTGSISKTTAKAIKELTLLRVGDKLVNGRKVGVSTSQKLKNTIAKAKKVLKGKLTLKAKTPKLKELSPQDIININLKEATKVKPKVKAKPKVKVKSKPKVKPKAKAKAKVGFIRPAKIGESRFGELGKSQFPDLSGKGNIFSASFQKGGETIHIDYSKGGQATISKVNEQGLISVLKTIKASAKSKNVLAKQLSKVKTSTQLKALGILALSKLASASKLKTKTLLDTKVKTLEKFSLKELTKTDVAVKTLTDVKFISKTKVAVKSKVAQAVKVKVAQDVKFVPALKLKTVQRLRTKKEKPKKFKFLPPKKITITKAFKKPVKKVVTVYKFSPTIVRPRKRDERLRLFTGAELR